MSGHSSTEGSRIRTRAALVLAAALAISGVAQPASADPTPVDITVTAEAYAIDVAGQITSDQEFLYDSSRGDTADTAYLLAYRGILDMQQVWASYRTFKLLWLFANENDTARWQAKTFSGHWTIGFQIDTDVVSVNPDFLDCAVVQSASAEQNPTTSFFDIMRCSEVRYDSATGEMQIDFVLRQANGSAVTGAVLDQTAYQPATLRLTTPPRALYVPQSNFEAGRSFDLVDPMVSGEMTMDNFYKVCR